MKSKKIRRLFLFFIIFTLILAFSSCYKGPEENCVFINEKANLHNEYYITVLDCTDQNSIFVLKNKGDLEETELIGTDKHFISVTILLQHINVSEEKEAHSLDTNDFKIKDHTGIQIGNLNLFSKENGLALENKDFSTTKAQLDYKWVDNGVEPGDQKTIILYFEVPKSISTTDTTIVLEADFFSGRTNKKAGTDIVLAQRSTKG